MAPNFMQITGGILGAVVILLIAVTVRERSLLPRPETSTSKHTIRSLPGYTGWARPSSTLADTFRIVDAKVNTAYADSDWEIRLSCDACTNSINPPTLFVRAYGPAILTGTVQTETKGIYSLTLHPMHSGKYVLEVVVTYSLGIDYSSYPLSKEQLPPQHYEGYLVNGFPFDFEVLPRIISPDKNRVNECKKEDLLFEPRTKADLWKRGTWRVASTIHENSFDNTESSVSLDGYQSGQNSIGFNAEYELNSGCRLAENLESLISCTSKRIRVVLIGDSVMRLQRDLLIAHLDPDKFKIEFYELYGGILLCSRLSGPSISDLVHKFADHPTSDEEIIVIFNSGMHDIHRLCGHQYAGERRTYLSDAETAMPCTDVYRRAMTELVITVRQIPSIVRVFQTTHAAWPKYGNYGVAWDPRYAQELPLDSAFVQRFNDIAIDVIEQLNTQSSTARIAAIDSYWMTLARPDNRETSKNADIGKKLSHPGREVTSSMVRILWQAVLLLACDPS